MTRVGLSVVASAGLLWLAAGCGARWEGLPQGRQVAVHRGRGLLEERADLIVSAAHAPVPFADAEELLAFTVEITNRGQAPVEVTLDQFGLRDKEGRLRRPMEPEQLLRGLGYDSEAPTKQPAGGGYEATVASGTRVVLAVHRARFWRYHYHRYCPDRARYWYPYWYGYWHYGYPPYPAGYYSDWAYAEAERQRVARFMAEAWRPVGVSPDEVRAGYVIFRHPSEKHDQVVLLFRPPQIAAEITTKPATVEFSFHFVRTR